MQIDALDGELALGMVESHIGTGGTLKGLWFGRKDSAKSWGVNPTFEHYCDRNGRIVDALDKDSFLYEIQKSDLTDASVANQLVSPRLNAEFMLKLRELAKLKKLRAEDMGAPAKPAAPPAPPTAQLTTDLVRGKDFTVNMIKEALSSRKLNAGSRHLKADLLDLLLAYITLDKSNHDPGQAKLPPLPSMLFFESEKEKLDAKKKVGAVEEENDQSELANAAESTTSEK